MKASAIFRLRWAVVWGLILAAGLGAWGLWGRPAPKPPALLPARVQHEAPTRPKMETLALTEVEDGNKRWILEAKDAEYLKEQKTIRITGIKVEFFGEGGRVLKVSCQEGLINTKSRALTLRGRVRLEEGDLIIKTETVHYQPKERLLVAPEEVVLESPRLTIRGQGLRVELRSRRLALIRHQSTEVKLTGKGWLK